MPVDIGAIGASHRHPTWPFLRSSQLVRLRDIVVLLLFASMFATDRISPQPVPYQSDAFQER